MKRVVTTTNEQGRSCVGSIEELDPSQSHIVWDYEPGQVIDAIKSVDPAVAAEWIGPKVPGGARWYFASLEPDTETAGHLPLEGLDEAGFHTTRTVDFDLLVEGELTLVLDDGSVNLEKGDFVVQQATRHAWRNSSDRTAIMITLIHRPEGV